METSVDLPAGYCLDFWAQGPGTVRIEQGESILWQVPVLPSYSDFFTYRHGDAGSVTISVDRPAAILWAYGYDPTTVVDKGITVWEFGDEGLVLRQGAEIEQWMASDLTRPMMHFSPIRNWMNDPNGLCRIGDTWHMFYQFHPQDTEWGPMHWGHATSKDLFNWTHLPVFLHPAQNLWRLGATGGAFSGNAFEDRDGSQMFFYTERLPAYDLFTGYQEVQKLARPDQTWLYARSVETVLATRPIEDGVKHDFRDPKVWWDAEAGAYRMVLGAALHGDPAVLLYGSPNLTDWTYLGPIYRAPAHFRDHGARAVECPDFFPLDGKWVMIMGFVGYTEPESGRHNLLFALVGDFRNDIFVPDGRDLQILDFGTDFYAMQSFRAGDRQIAFAWLFNWEFRKPPGSTYSGEMSLPREIGLDAAGRVLMQPARELEMAWPAHQLSPGPDGSFALRDAPLDIRLEGLLDGTTITAMQGAKLSFEVTLLNAQLAIQLPQDNGSIHYEVTLNSAKDLRVIFDRGVVELFAENGSVCGTRRSYENIAPDKLNIASDSAVSVLERERLPPTKIG